MDLELRGKRAVITGGSVGIGLAVAHALASEGVDVAIVARDGARAEREAGEIAASHRVKALAIAADVSKAGDVERSCARVAAAFDGVDILINNAGAHPPNDGSGLAVSNEAMSAAFSINCLGALQVTQGLVGVLAKSPAARIINVSTILALPSWLDQMAGSYFAYRISKTALNAVTVGLAAELKDQHISVNAIHPGWLQTAMGGPNAPDPVEVGASAVLNLALDVPSTVSGRMFAKNELIGW